MKTEKEIQDNLNAKLATWLVESHSYKSELDWVLNDGLIREIDVIEKEARAEIEAKWEGEGEE
jgi:hypothetical protein